MCYGICIEYSFVSHNIPDTMMKFTSFEATVDALYAYVVPTPKAQCSKGYQLGISFAAGYIAGVLCAIVSHPADNLVSYLNNKKGASIGQVSLIPKAIFS